MSKESEKCRKEGRKNFETLRQYFVASSSVVVLKGKGKGALVSLRIDWERRWSGTKLFVREKGALVISDRLAMPGEREFILQNEYLSSQNGNLSKNKKLKLPR